jgi:hypothetical protein
MQAFKEFQQGCTLFDVVLELYLSLNLLPKLIIDNDIKDLNAITTTGQVFKYDTELISNEIMSEEIKRKNYQFCTAELKIFNRAIVGDYLLIESQEVLKDEANNLFIY